VLLRGATRWRVLVAGSPGRKFGRALADVLLGRAEPGGGYDDLGREADVPC